MDEKLLFTNYINNPWSRPGYEIFPNNPKIKLEAKLCKKCSNCSIQWQCSTLFAQHEKPPTSHQKLFFLAFFAGIGI